MASFQGVRSLSFGNAVADPAAFRRWWKERMERWFRISREFTQPDPLGLNPFVLTPGSTVTQHHSEIRINQLGFRGPEIEREKGEYFRIVAIGESTTFGLTLNSDDRPWPELLEEEIRADYTCAAPVQVINAGIPGWTISNQVSRLPHDILPLEPDVILSYHGYNGFDFFLLQLPPVSVHQPPEPPPRPSRILGRLEREARLYWFRRRYRDARALEVSVLDVDPLRNPYADQYRSLLQLARDHGVEVVLATFNMAVDARSPEAAIRFYEQTVPDARARIAANRIHTRVVQALGRFHPITVIDTAPGLDGAYRDAYVDITHFNQRGRDRLAANLLAGLHEILTTHPRLRCRPRLP